ncbi:RHS repeat domain-containing protein [Paenibacillus phytohabitans]|nr:RHS repeat-associated core domain-containing protein [Paenibacillus phytohabitans]
MSIRHKSLITRITLVVLCVTLLLSGFPVNAANDNKENIIIDSSNLAIDESNESSFQTEPATVKSAPLTPQNLSSVTATVYDQEMNQSLARIKALSLQRDKQRVSSKGAASTGKSKDLIREQMEQLVMAGATKEDLYWINMISEESGLSPDKLLELKKSGNSSWDEIELQTNPETLAQRLVVEENVYKEEIEKQFVSNPLTVADSVYGDYEVDAILVGNKDLTMQKFSSFDFMANSVFSGLITQQQINQTNKPQYSDRKESNEFIDPVNGALTWKETEISLPGRDGLDLDVGIMYNSNQSYTYMRQYEAPGLKKYNYLLSRYDLGLGWSFQFPSVQLADGYIYYHDGQGAVYQVDFFSGDALGSYSHLVGFQGKDRKFMQDSGTYNNGQASSAYYLEYNDLKREYFAADGRLLGIVDRYGNTIRFEHVDRKTYDGVTNKMISSITDSVGRTVKFTYETNLDTTDVFNGENIVVSVLNSSGADTQKVTFKKWRSSLIHNNVPAGYAPFLWSITDQMEQVTYMNYKVDPGKFHYEQKVINSYSGSTNYYNLATISYPYSTSNYQYQSVLRNFGSAGFGEEWRVKSRNDVMKKTYNQVNYDYTGDYTGYDTYYNPYTLPESYGFSSTSKIVSTTASNDLFTTSNFNGLHQQISTVVLASGGERKETRNTAFHPTYKYLPTRMISAEYGGGDVDNSANTLYSDVTYTDWGTIQSQTRQLTLSQINDPNTKLKNTITYAYEPIYHFIQSKSWYQNDSTALTESYEYYSDGRLKSYKNPKQEQTNYNYEPIAGDKQKVRTMTEEKPMGNGFVSKKVITYGADTNYGLPAEVISYFTNISASGQQSTSLVKKIMTYDMPTGNVLTETDGSGKQTVYTYDLLGRVMTTTYPEVINLNGEQYTAQDQFTYTKVYASTAYFDAENQGIYYLNVNSKRKYTQKSTGTITYFSELNDYYDGFGILRLNQVTGVGGIGQMTQYRIDDLCRAIYVIDPVENTTSVRYNAWGQEVEALDTYGNLYVNEYNFKQRKVSNYYIAAADITAYRANMGNSSYKGNYVEQTYDQWGQLIRNLTYKDWPGQSQPITEKYGYDLAGNVVTYTDPNNNVNNEGVTTKYGYDNLSQLISVKNALGQITSYQYDVNGQMTEVTMRSSETAVPIHLKSKNYNEIGKVYDKKDAAFLSENQVYNQLGLVEQKKDRNATVYSYQYDARDQIVSSLITGSGGNTQQSKVILGSSGIKTDTNELYNNGSKTSWQTVTIDNLKRINKVTSQATGYTAYSTYAFDLANRTTQTGISHTGIGTSYTKYQYNKNHLEKVQTNGSATLNNAASVNAVYEYFPTGSVKSITYPTLADGSVLKSEYTYDALNRISTLVNKKGATVLSSYIYLSDNNGNITYITESVNNGASRTTTTYTYDKLNRLESISRAAGSSIYKYDLQGNRQTQQDTASNVITELGDTSYTYDLMNLLTGVTQDAKTVLFSYLPGKLRYQKTANSIVTQYNYDINGNVISEYKSSGQKAYYIRGDRLLVKKDVAAGKDYYYLYNGHGDVVQIVDTAGVVVNSYAYDEWGKIISQSEGIPNSFKYAGEIYDEETGLYYLRARYYDPSMGRFLNEDTYEGQIDNPLSLNLYTYVHNNPLIYVDPTGQWCESKDGKYSHPGTCSNPNSGVYSADVKHNGEAMKSNGKSTGIYKFDYGDGVHEDNSLTGALFDVVVTGGVGLGKSLVKGATKGIASLVSSGTGSVFKSGIKTLKNFVLDDAFVKTKHLSTTGGNGAKFLGNTKAEAEAILKDVMKNGQVKNVIDNGLTKQGNQSYEIVIAAGKTIGTRGETLLKIILSEDGAMLTAYPIK